MKPNSSRLQVAKTYKLFIGGKFPRTESGRSAPALGPDGKTVLANYCPASRKDFRDAVVAARAAVGKWSGSSAYLRGQVLYRAAEMLECRATEMAGEIQRATGCSATAAADEVARSVDLLVHYAGWTDKFPQIASAVNPVASPHFNFTFPEPTGLVVAVCPDAPAFLPLVALAAPALASGNTVIALASGRSPLPAVTFAEILATSDLPGGSLNILTGSRAELAPFFASHMDVNAVVDGAGDPAITAILRGGAAENLKRVSTRSLTPREWLAHAGDPYWIADTVEFKTAWHPMGV